MLREFEPESRGVGPMSPDDTPISRELETVLRGLMDAPSAHAVVVTETHVRQPDTQALASSWALLRCHDASERTPKLLDDIPRGPGVLS